MDRMKNFSADLHNPSDKLDQYKITVTIRKSIKPRKHLT